MVLFFEDEEKKPKREGRIWRRVLITALVIVFLAGTGLFFMSSLGGNHEALKKGFAEYLSGATGMQAQIGRFDYMGFFPVMRIEAGDIALTRPGQEAPSVTIGSIEIARHFADQLLSRPRMDRLDIRDVKISAGIVSKEGLVIERLALDEKGFEDKPALIVKGVYDSDSFSAHVPVDVVAVGGERKFSRPKSASFFFDAPFLKAEGQFLPSFWGGYRADFKKLEIDGVVLSGEVFFKPGEKGFVIKTDLREEKGQYLVELRQKKKRIKGVVSVPQADPGELISVVNAISNLYDKIALPDPSQTTILPQDIKMDLEIGPVTLVAQGQKIGTFFVPVHQESGVLKAGPLQGGFYGGKLKGNMVLTGNADPGKIDIKISAKEVDFGVMQNTLFGQKGAQGNADIHVSLAGSARSMQDFPGALSGEAALVAGKGTFDNRLINIWGAGLLNALMPKTNPDEDMTLNCLIADFKFDKGVGKAAPLFMDTEKVTIAGEGTINLPDNKIDVLLKPKAKEAAIITVATAVRLGGGFGNVSVRPDTLSLGATLGKLALGAINPAFMVFSMTDLGLSENHPCSAYFSKEPAP